MPCPEGCALGPISLCDGGHTSADNASCPHTLLSVTEANTRTTTEEAGLFENKHPQVRWYEEAADAESLSMEQTESSVYEDRLFDRTVTADAAPTIA